MAAVEPMIVKLKLQVDTTELVKGLRDAADALEKLQFKSEKVNESLNSEAVIEAFAHLSPESLNDPKCINCGIPMSVSQRELCNGPGGESSHHEFPDA